MRRDSRVRLLGLACLAALHAAGAAEGGDPEYDDGFQPVWHLSVGGGTTFLEPEGESAGFSATGEDGSGAKIALGRTFTPRWGWELAYTDAGEAPLSNPNPAIQAQVPDASINYKIASALATYSLGGPDSTFRLLGKLGASSIANEPSDPRIVVSKDSSVQAAYGAGLELRLSRRWFLRAEYEHYARDAAFAGLSLGFRFGGGRGGNAATDETPHGIPTVIEYPLYVAEEQAAVIEEDRAVVTGVADELSEISEQLRAAARTAQSSPEKNREAAKLAEQAETLTDTSHRMGIVEESILRVREVKDISQVDPETFVNDQGERLLLTPAEQASELDVARRNIDHVEQSVGDRPIIRTKLRRVGDRIAIVSESLLYVPPSEKEEAEQLCEELKILEKTVQFHSESTRITGEAQQFLDRVARKMQRHPRIVLAIHAHTDSWGTYAFNQRLSEHRANAARDYLVQKGVAGARLTAVGFGEWEPLASNKTLKGRQQNRRVEFVIKNPNICR